jgi:pyruvate/2-oxoglutarate dehydrogenase complex dihydrolipoamide dehydrogenase (E3) component
MANKEGYEMIKGHSQLTTQFPIMPDKKELRVQVLADKKTHQILGGQVLSGEPVTSLIDIISFAIQQGATINDLANLSYSAQPYQSFFPANNAIVMAAEQMLEQIRE